MSSARLIAALAILALVVGGSAYFWWSAPPAADEAELAAALALAPPVEGRLVLAQPQRAARLFVRHPQALGLLAAAAPETRWTMSHLQPVLRPFVAAARGPLTIWWSGRDVALATRLRPGAIRALALLAARHGLHWEADGETARIATAASLLAPAATPSQMPTGQRRLAGLTEAGGHLWQLTAGRHRLEAAWGAETPTPDGPGPSHAETRDASRLVRLLGFPIDAAPVAARAVFGAGHGWGVTIAGTRLPEVVRDAIRPVGLPGAASSPRRWNGFLGDVWVRDGGETVSIGTDEAVLARLAEPPTGEQGRVTGADLAWLANELAAALERLPLLDREARSLRATATQAAGLGVVRWRATADGARIDLEW
jgi:hypothetical protein